jgi:hypothetical protein
MQFSYVGIPSSTFTFKNRVEQNGLIFEFLTAYTRANVIRISIEV